MSPLIAREQIAPAAISDQSETSFLHRKIDVAKQVVGRLALVLGLIGGPSTAILTLEAVTSPSVAYAADTGGYPYADAPCYPPSVRTRIDGSTYCSGYDWRVPTKDSSGNITGWPDYTERGFVARNCTDWADLRANPQPSVM